MKKQLIFYKGGRLRFVGHLDMMRTMQRALTRAGIPLAYSQGFNPHPHMSFASPLALGCTGERDIMEIRIEKDMTDREVMDGLNEQLPEGLRILAVRTVEGKEDAIMAKVKINEYRIEFPKDLDAQEAMNDLMAQETIMLTKLAKVHGRKQPVQIDVKPLIFGIDWTDEHTMVIRCAGGSETNLKPELLLEKIYQTMGCPDRQHEEKTSRVNMYGREEDGSLVCLTDYSGWSCQ